MKKNKLPMFLLALGAAILVWLYDVTVVNPNDTSTISGITWPPTPVNIPTMIPRAMTMRQTPKSG